MNDVIYWLWLSTSPRIGPRAITSLLKYYGGPEQMYFAPVGEITRLLPRNIEGAEELEKRDLDAAKRIFEKCDNDGIDVITLNEDAYPERLRNIHLPPAVIYVKGKLPNMDAEPVIAVIGTAVSLCIQAIVSDWMDVVSIYICPLGALLAGILFFWVAGKDFVLAAVNKGAGKPIGAWFYPLSKYVYCACALLALIAGALLGGIG